MSVAFLDALISGARSTSANRFERVVTYTDCRSLLTSSAGLAARQERVTEVDHCSTFLWSWTFGPNADCAIVAARIWWWSPDVYPALAGHFALKLLGFPCLRAVRGAPDQLLK